MPVQNSDNISIEVKNKAFHVLSIKSAKPELAGKYTMKAKNDDGEAECSMYLAVDGKLKFL